MSSVNLPKYCNFCKHAKKKLTQREVKCMKKGISVMWFSICEVFEPIEAIDLDKDFKKFCKIRKPGYTRFR